MNKHGANDPMRNVYQEAAETTAKTYLNKHQRTSRNPEQNSKGEEEQGQSQTDEEPQLQSTTQPKNGKERYVMRKELLLKGKFIQKGIKPTKSGGLKFPNGKNST